jgi:hypothetical protein
MGKRETQLVRAMSPEQVAAVTRLRNSLNHLLDTKSGVKQITKPALAGIKEAFLKCAYALEPLLDAVASEEDELANVPASTEGGSSASHF